MGRWRQAPDPFNFHFLEVIHFTKDTVLYVLSIGTLYCLEPSVFSVYATYYFHSKLSYSGPSLPLQLSPAPSVTKITCLLCICFSSFSDETSKHLTSLKVLCSCLCRGDQSLCYVYEEYEVNNNMSNKMFCSSNMHYLGC